MNWFTKTKHILTERDKAYITDLQFVIQKFDKHIANATTNFTNKPGENIQHHLAVDNIQTHQKDLQWCIDEIVDCCLDTPDFDLIHVLYNCAVTKEAILTSTKNKESRQWDT